MIFDNGDGVAVVVDATVYNSTACFDRTSTRHGGNDDDDGIVAELILLYIRMFGLYRYMKVYKVTVDVVYLVLLVVLWLKSQICVWLLNVTS